jgi:hypothetical protein
VGILQLVFFLMVMANLPNFPDQSADLFHDDLPVRHYYLLMLLLPYYHGDYLQECWSLILLKVIVDCLSSEILVN